MPVNQVYQTNKVSLENLRSGVERFVAPQMYYILKENSGLTKFIHDNVHIIGQPVCDNTIEKVSEHEFCKVFDELEVKKLRQLSLFDDPEFWPEKTKKSSR